MYQPSIFLLSKNQLVKSILISKSRKTKYITRCGGLLNAFYMINEVVQGVHNIYNKAPFNDHSSGDSADKVFQSQLDTCLREKSIIR